VIVPPTASRKLCFAGSARARYLADLNAQFPRVFLALMSEKVSFSLASHPRARLCVIPACVQLVIFHFRVHYIRCVTLLQAAKDPAALNNSGFSATQPAADRAYLSIRDNSDSDGSSAEGAGVAAVGPRQATVSCGEEIESEAAHSDDRCVQFEQAVCGD
jgi:hypothetical protein